MAQGAARADGHRKPALVGQHRGDGRRLAAPDPIGQEAPCRSASARGEKEPCRAYVMRATAPNRPTWAAAGRAVWAVGLWQHDDEDLALLHLILAEIPRAGRQGSWPPAATSGSPTPTYGCSNCRPPSPAGRRGIHPRVRRGADPVALGGTAELEGASSVGAGVCLSPADSCSTPAADAHRYEATGLGTGTACVTLVP